MSSFQPGLAILGGTFDPVHFGHLQIAVESREKLSVESVKLVPSYYSYHREDPGINAEIRAAMLEMAVDGVDGLEVDRVELNRKGHSYTVDTLDYFRKQKGDDFPIVLLLGEDTFASLNEWHEWERILDLAHLGIIKRQGFSSDFQPILNQLLEARGVSEESGLMNTPGGKLAFLNLTPMGISASMVRQRIHEGLAIDFLVPASVKKFIETKNLYRNK